MDTPKLSIIALWPSSLSRQGDWHVGTAPSLLPVLSKKYIIESFLPPRYLEPRVSVFVLRIK